MKEPLTIDMVHANKMTPLDCVKYFRPEWSDQDCDHYLWNLTCYPFNVIRMIEQLNDQLGTDETS